MEQIFLLAIMIIGFLVMFQVIPLNRVFGFILMVIALYLLAPILFMFVTAQISSYFSGPHRWWEYVIAFLVVLIIIRIMLNIVFPWRRR